MKSEEHDDLWELLGKAKAPQVSPFFSRNVLRALRQEAQQRPSFLAWLRHKWQVAAISTCALLAGGLVLRQRAGVEADFGLLAEQFASSPDYEVVSHLDELIDSEESSVWLAN